MSNRALIKGDYLFKGPISLDWNDLSSRKRWNQGETCPKRGGLLASCLGGGAGKGEREVAYEKDDENKG